MYRKLFLWQRVIKSFMLVIYIKLRELLLLGNNNMRCILYAEICKQDFLVDILLYHQMFSSLNDRKDLSMGLNNMFQVLS